MIIGYDYEVWYQYQLLQSINMELRTHPSMLITGSSGSGKSYALKYLIWNLLQECVSLYFCNFKKSADFQFLQNHSDYYTYLDCCNGLEKFYADFKQAQEQDIEFNGEFHILVFDEYPAFILATSMRDKKLAERYKVMISEILMSGRSYGYGVWLIMQRPDSRFFSDGARDNFQATISLGNFSIQAKTMLYPDAELPKRVYKAGEGICWIDGVGLKEIKFPLIRNMRKLEDEILHQLACVRPQGSTQAGGVV